MISTQLRSEHDPDPDPVEPAQLSARSLELIPHPFRHQTQGWGRVEPKIEVTLSAQVSGVISELSPELLPGEVFSAGSYLLTIESSDYRLALIRAQAELAAANLHWAQEQAEAEIVVLEANESTSSTPPSGLALREPQLEEASRRREAAEAAVEQAHLDLSRTQVYSPMPARAQTRLVEIGQYVGIGEKLVTLHSIDYAEIRIPVPQSAKRVLSSSSSLPSIALLSRDGASTQSHAPLWIGIVTRVEPDVDPQTGMSHVVVQVADPFRLSPAREGPALQPGMLVHAVIVSEPERPGFWIPRSALTQSGQALIVAADGTLVARDLTVALALDDWLVAERGFTQGEHLCLDPPPIFIEGTAPLITEVSIDELPIPIPRPLNLEELLRDRAIPINQKASLPTGTSSLGTSSLDRVESSLRSPKSDDTSWEVQTQADGIEIYVSTVPPKAIRSFVLENPLRRVIDLEGVSWPHAPATAALPLPHLRARVAQFKGSPTPITRIVIDLSRPIEAPFIDSGPDGLRIKLEGRNQRSEPLQKQQTEGEEPDL